MHYYKLINYSYLPSLCWVGAYKGEDFLNSEDVIKKKAAREILSMIETVCFSKEFAEYRVNYGSKGERDLIIENIKRTYGVG